MRKTTHFAMLTTALVALVPMAQAQDVNQDGKTDFYLGVLGGFAGGTSTVNDAVDDHFHQYLDPAELGVVGGFRFNQNDWLMGIEADVNANLGNSFAPAGIATFANVEGNGHVRGLLGRQMGPLSLFVTGGLAGTQVKYNNIDDGVDDKLMLGWTVGVGAEYAVSENVALRIEGLHDETTSTFSDGYNGKWVENTVRVGALFKF